MPLGPDQQYPPKRLRSDPVPVFHGRNCDVRGSRGDVARLPGSPRALDLHGRPQWASSYH